MGFELAAPTESATTVADKAKKNIITDNNDILPLPDDLPVVVE